MPSYGTEQFIDNFKQTGRTERKAQLTDINKIALTNSMERDGSNKSPSRAIAREGWTCVFGDV